ncbi:MAG: glycosyltransferase [Actinobacteria bacterium]|nr:glycosyltransferase [Actinomycetota bacterium]
MASRSRLKVLQVITHLDVGGATEAAANACAHVDRQSFDSTLVSGPPPEGQGDYTERFRALGLRVMTVPGLQRAIHPARDRQALHHLRRLFREEEPDIVHTHSSKAGVLGRLAAHREHVPAVLHTVHGWSFHEHMASSTRAIYRRLERRAAKWCTRLVTVSYLDRAKGLAAGIGTPEQYTTIRDLNDLAPYTAGAGTGSVARARFGLSADGPIIGTVGRLSDQKAPLTWMRAAAAIAGRRPDAGFVMVGDGPLRADVEQLAAELGVSDQLVLTGLRDDVPSLLPAFDVFLLTSRWEGLPLVIPQAMAAEVPVVATTADGNQEIIRDGANGTLVAPEDPDAAAAAVLALIDDPELRYRLVTTARETATEFSLEQTIPKLEALYLECAARDHSPASE